MRFLRQLYLLALGVWLGAILFFGAVLAPKAFEALPRRTAADLVGSNLTSLHYMGFVCAGVAIACALITRQRSLRTALVAGMLALTAISQFGITPRIHAIREQPDFELQASAQQHRNFARLHAASTTAEGIVLLLGLGAFFARDPRED